TAELVQEVSAASREQTTGIEQTNKALQELDQVTQQNAAAAEELSAASDELAGQAKHMLAAVSFFKLGKLDEATRTQRSDTGAAAPSKSSANRGRRQISTR